MKRSGVFHTSIEDSGGELPAVLVADDTAADRMILENLVRQFGYRVITAENGLDAVAKFSEERPGIVLLDVLMPGLDGFDVAKQIKALAGEEFVPIIFLTSLSDPDSLVRCLNAGGDDFLSKPYNKIILQAKITAFTRMRAMQTTILSQRDKIANHNSELIREQNVAKEIFDNIAHGGCLDARNIQYYLSPLSIFNGDVLVAAFRPSGNVMALLGDFTGHGLPAAMGAIPLATTFYDMVEKGHSMVDVAREINRKLKDILPLGMFCCACLIDVDFRGGNVKVWSGGLPAGYLVRKNNNSIQRLESRNLPLGILSEHEFKTQFERYELNLGDRIFLWSDGIHEARNVAGEMFGEERLLALFDTQSDYSLLVDNVVSNVHSFMGEKERDDDLTIFGIEIVEPESVHSKTLPVVGSDSRGLADWSLSFSIGANTFSGFDPLPILLQILNEVRGLRLYSNILFTILAELYSNALEHGILGLDSQLKSDPEGFMRYYELRKELLGKVEEGFIRFEITHKEISVNPRAGRLYIRVIDSGDGFAGVEEVNALMAAPGNDVSRYWGRGISLLKNICESVVYRGSGNQVDVVFAWHEESK